MHILYFADIRFPLERANGIQTFQTCRALAARGHRVELIVRPDTAVPPRDPFVFYGDVVEANLVVRALKVVGGLHSRRASWMAQALGRALAARRVDVAFSRDLAFTSLLLGIPRALRPPIVYESHGFAPVVGATLDRMLTDGRRASGRKQDRLERREARVWRRAEGYVTITRALADELSSRFGARSTLDVVPDGVRLTGAAPPPVVRRDPPVVAYAGHLYPWKGVDVLLQAVQRLNGVHALIIGGLAGEADLERTRGVARDLGVTDRVAFAGAVAPPQVAGLLTHAAVLALPNTATHVSSRYTSPLKLFEYMAAGRPIVASNLPALREVLRDGENSLLVEPGDADEMANAIRRLLDDVALAGRLTAAAWRDVQAYGWDRRAERLEALLVSLGPERQCEPRGETV